MRRLVRLEAAESGQKSPKTVISWQAVQSAVSRIGGAGEGGRESRSARPGGRDRASEPAGRGGGEPCREIRAPDPRPAPRPGGGAGGRAFRRRCPWGRRADSSNCRFGVPGAPAARLRGSFGFWPQTGVRSLAVFAFRACGRGARRGLAARRRESPGGGPQEDSGRAGGIGGVRWCGKGGRSAAAGCGEGIRVGGSF